MLIHNETHSTQDIDSKYYMYFFVNWFLSSSGLVPSPVHILGSASSMIGLVLITLVTYTILLCLQIIHSNQFSPVCTLDRVMVDLSFSRGCTSKKWTREITKKIDLASLVNKMAWNFDRWCVSAYRTVLQQFLVSRCPNYFYLGSVSEEISPMGAPSTWILMYFIVISCIMKL